MKGPCGLCILSIPWLRCMPCREVGHQAGSFVGRWRALVHCCWQAALLVRGLMWTRTKTQRTAPRGGLSGKHG